MQSINSTQAIQAENLSKHFGTVQALRDVTLSIPNGQTVALLGANGAGKSTLLDLILGLTTPTSGSVRTHGRIGAVLQTGGLLPDVTVQDTIRMIAATYGTDPTPAITMMGPLRTRRIRACSGGEQQRVKLALALLAHPELLILDEPSMVLGGACCLPCPV